MPRALSESQPLRYVVFTALYIAQGLPWGFIATPYLVFLTDLGFDAEAVGAAMGVAYVPWSFKFAYGPLLDRVGGTRWGRRRPFIIGAQFLMGLSLLSLLTFDPAKNVALMTAILFLHNAFAALQDVAIDAMAVDLVPPEQQGRANSLMWAGKLLGVAIGGGGGIWLSQYVGWNGLLATLAVAIWAIMILAILFRERPEAVAAPNPGRFDWATLKWSFGFWTPWGAALIAFLTPVGYALVGAATTHLQRDRLKLDENHLAFLTGTVDPIAGVAGALVGGFMADRVGARRTMGGWMVVIGFILAGFGLSEARWTDYSFLVVYTAALSFSVASYNAATFGYFMSVSNPAIGATTFALYMAATNLTYAWTSPIGGRISDQYGPVAMFLAAAAIQVGTIVFLPLADPAPARARYAAVGATAAGHAPVG